jgi:hypothetical protein
MVTAAVAAAREGYAASGPDLPPPVAPHAAGAAPLDASIDLAVDHLSIELGKRILDLVGSGGRCLRACVRVCERVLVSVRVHVRARACVCV